MKKAKYLLAAAVVGAVAALSFAYADEHHGGGHMPPEPRSHGIPQHGSFHHVSTTPHGPIEHRQIFHEQRGLGDIRRDPHMVRFSHVGWAPRYHWDHWYRDWGVFWRVSNWGDIRNVTCEAVDQATGALFPVTESRTEAWVWDVNTVNLVAARALDECAAETGDQANCTLVDGECWHSQY